MEAAQLADDLKAQLELAQKKLHDFQDEIVENSVTKEKDMFNFKRAQVNCFFFTFYLLGGFWTVKWPMLWKSDLLYVISYLIISSLSEDKEALWWKHSPNPVMVRAT